MVRDYSLVPVDMLDRIDQACAAFESEWQQARPPRVADYVASVPETDQALLLMELLLLDMDYRGRRGERMDAQAYLAEFPQHRQLIEEIVATGTRSSEHLSSAAAPALPDQETSPSRASAEQGTVLLGRYRVREKVGEGGFGAVYCAFDEVLQRPVAVKVPHTHRVASRTLNSFLDEARRLAKLEHPHIVPVYDVDRVDDGPFHVVYRFIEGEEFGRFLDRAAVPREAVVEVLATVAEALDFAHRRKLIHRDIKPSNILVDKLGSAWLVDFGAALHDDDTPKARSVAMGTIAYMSPEQLLGEGHVVDGRSDVYSLGVVMYEALSGRRPFQAAQRTQLIDLITSQPPTPMRQLDDRIPEELDRICLKAMSKRVSDRYETAGEMAVDLRNWLRRRDESNHDRHAVPVTVVPKGLRSFDGADASFYLQLLPGPRDRGGLPECVRFWKHRIESRSRHEAFRVGLLTGPSGSGKSSLVKAGILPQLGPDVIPVYVSATNESLNRTLLDALASAVGELASWVDLAESLNELRTSHDGTRPKILLVIDQFEQWLLDHRPDDELRLVRALRQCDGARVQALLLVRGDYVMAASRFLDQLDVVLSQHENLAIIDLFDTVHAQHVLAAFGQAFGRLPQCLSQCTAAQTQFLRRSTEALSEDGLVVPVRLAMFAEMVKGISWTSASVRDVGGAEGVGVAFLRQSFGPHAANPRYRRHRLGACRVLGALLPQPGTNVRRHPRSYTELFEVSHYPESAEFDALMQILDTELKLVTPVESEAADGSSDPRIQGLAPAARPDPWQPLVPRAEGQMDQPSPHSMSRSARASSPVGVALESADVRDPRAVRAKQFQLTHDFLIEPIRIWLSREQQRTLRGRAERQLSERTNVWQRRREPQQLPGALEYATIRVLTRPRRWSRPQREMMRRAGRRHLARLLSLVTLAVLSTLLVQRWSATQRAQQEVRDLLQGDMAHVIHYLDRLSDHPVVYDLLRATLRKSGHARNTELKARLALVRQDPVHVQRLYDLLLEASPIEAEAIRAAFVPRRASVLERLWATASSPVAVPDEKGRVLVALAAVAPHDPRWSQAAPTLVDWLVQLPDPVLPDWLRLLDNVSDRLIQPATEIFWNRQDELAGTRAARLLAEALANDYESLLKMIPRSTPMQLAALVPKLRADEATVNYFRQYLPSVVVSRPIGGQTMVPEAFFSAGGVLEYHFALAPGLSRESFHQFCNVLRPLGYRPASVRLGNQGADLGRDVIWLRDGREWRYHENLTPEAAETLSHALTQQDFMPIDVSCYLPADPHHAPASIRLAILAVKRQPYEPRHRLLAGRSLEEFERRYKDSRAQIVVAHDRLLRTPHERVDACILADRSEGLEGIARDLASTSVRLNPPAFPSHRTYQVVQSAMADANDPDRQLSDYEVVLYTPPEIDSSWFRAIPWPDRNDPSKGLVFRGDTNMHLARMPFDEWPQFTVEAWVQDWNGRIFTQGQQGDPGNSIWMAIGTWPSPWTTSGWEVNDGEINVYAEPLGVAVLHGLHHVAMVYDGRDQVIYLDGHEHSRHAVPSPGSLDSGPLTLGQEESFGLLRAFRVSNRVRYTTPFQPARTWSADEATQLLLQFSAAPAPPRPRRDFGDSLRGRPGSLTVVALHETKGRHPAAARQLADVGFRPMLMTRGDRGDSPEQADQLRSVWLQFEEMPADLLRRRVNAAAVLLALGQKDGIPDHAWGLEQLTLRSELISCLAKAVPPKLLGDLLESRHQEAKSLGDAAIQCILLALAERPAASLSVTDVKRLKAEISQLCQEHPDPGVHVAAAAVLRKWNPGESPPALQLTPWDQVGRRRWFLNERQQTFSVVEAGATELDNFIMPRRLAVSTTEVTQTEFMTFMGRPLSARGAVGDAPAAANHVSFLDAAQFCNWLSQQSGIPVREWCYVRSGQMMKPVSNYQQRLGYRLPTDAEWEFIARDLSAFDRGLADQTRFAPGNDRSSQNSAGKIQPVGLLRPNRFGLFDLFGNVAEWAVVYGVSFNTLKGGSTAASSGKMLSWYEADHTTRVSPRRQDDKRRSPAYDSWNTGFRVVRTLEPRFDDSAWADEVVEFSSPDIVNQDRSPEDTLGDGYWHAGTLSTKRGFSLGHGGRLVLAFRDNCLVDGPGPDLAVFDGGDFDPCRVAISPDGLHWIDVGITHSGTATLDIGPVIVGKATRFHYVRLSDAEANRTVGKTIKGVDVMAVGAIHSLPCEPGRVGSVTPPLADVTGKGK